MSGGEILAGASAAGSLFSAGASVFGGMSASGQGAAARQIAEFNAHLAEEDAAVARDRAASDAEDIRISTRKSLGALRADAGASGLVASEGSPLEAQVEAAGVGELNRLRRLWSGEMEARQHTIEAIGYRSRGAMAQYQGDQAAFGAYAGAGASLLTGASRLYNFFGSSGGGPPKGGGTAR